MKKYILFFFTASILIGCSSNNSISSNSNSLSYTDLNYCAFIENDKFMYAFSNTQDWAYLFKNFYLNQKFAPQHPALKYIDNEIKNFDFDVNNSDASFQTFLIVSQSWQKRCQELEQNPNN